MDLRMTGSDDCCLADGTFQVLGAYGCYLTAHFGTLLGKTFLGDSACNLSHRSNSVSGHAVLHVFLLTALTFLWGLEPPSRAFLQSCALVLFFPFVVLVVSCFERCLLHLDFVSLHCIDFQCCVCLCSKTFILSAS
jgi:hypothetical protein